MVVSTQCQLLLLRAERKRTVVVGAGGRTAGSSRLLSAALPGMEEQRRHRNCSSTGGLQLRWPGEARSSRGKGRRGGQRGEGGLSLRVQRRLAAAQSAKAARTAVVGLGELVVQLLDEVQVAGRDLRAQVLDLGAPEPRRRARRVGARGARAREERQAGDHRRREGGHHRALCRGGGRCQVGKRPLAKGHLARTFPSTKRWEMVAAISFVIPSTTSLDNLHAPARRPSSSSCIDLPPYVRLPKQRKTAGNNPGGGFPPSPPAMP